MLVLQLVCPRFPVLCFEKSYIWNIIQNVLLFFYLYRELTNLWTLQ